MSDRREFLKKTGIAAGAIAATGALRKAEAAASALIAPPRAAVGRADGRGHEGAPDGGAQRGEAGRRELRRRPHRAVPRQLRLHARAADHQRRRTPTRWAAAFARSSTARGDSRATRTLTKDGVAAAAREAAAIAKANRIARDRAVAARAGAVVSGRDLEERLTRSIRSRFRSSRRPTCCSRRTPRR